MRQTFLSMCRQAAGAPKKDSQIPDRLPDTSLPDTSLPDNALRETLP